MRLADLGKRILQKAQEHGKALLQDLDKDLRKETPSWDSIRSDLRQHTSRLRQEVVDEMRQWLEEQIQQNGGSWQTLWGPDPEIERAYQLLGLPYGTEVEKVKYRWRNLLMESHPDRNMSDPNSYDQATRLTQNLTAAYHNILKASEEGRI